jgi:hypothetical protein
MLFLFFISQFKFLNNLVQLFFVMGNLSASIQELVDLLRLMVHQPIGRKRSISSLNRRTCFEMHFDHCGATLDGLA